MVNKLMMDLEAFHPLQIGNRIYVPAWDTTQDEIIEATGLNEVLIEGEGDYYHIDLPDDDDEEEDDDDIEEDDE